MSKPSYKFPFDYFRGKMGDVVLCHGPKLQYARVYVPYNHSRKITEKEEILRYNFKRAVELWRIFGSQEKELYKKFAYYSTKDKLNGYSVFLREYINMVTDSNQDKVSHAKADITFWKAMEFWSEARKSASNPSKQEIIEIKEKAFNQARIYIEELERRDW